MGEVSTIGLDLAKNVFQVHGIDAAGRVLVRRQLRRGEVLAFFARLRPCLIGMEACATAHHWGRELTRLGHTVKLMPPAYVKPYVKRGKTDAADAEAIAEAASDDALRCRQEHGSAGGPDAAQGARSSGPAAHHADQRVAGPLG
jgi:transposase